MLVEAVAGKRERVGQAAAGGDLFHPATLAVQKRLGQIATDQGPGLSAVSKRSKQRM